MNVNLPRIMDALPKFQAGTVWLCGAGPGDAGLLTLLAAHGIAEADIIFYDALAGEDCLRLADPDAALRYVGKRGGAPSVTQAEITEMLIAAAQAAKKVLRLKGGDPFVFGRGGEEALALRAAGIPFRIVPGVTAGIAAAAYAGIPVSQRQMSQSFAFVTGHDAHGGLPANIDWRALAAGADVLVFYMAARNIASLVENLLKAGRAADEPFAFIINATLPNQRIIITCLGEAVKAAQVEKLTAPAILILGEVVNLHERLDWFLPEREGIADL